MTAIHYQRLGHGPPLLLLHATLSSSRQLRGLANRLSRRFTVISVDRRGSGKSVSEAPAEPIDVALHVDDLAGIMGAEDLGPALLVGHSYGGCVSLELAARRPELAAAVFAYEPPYGPVAPPAARAHMAEVARQTLTARDEGDLAGAALAFMEGVSGAGAVAALSPAARDRIGRSGQGAVADATLSGMDPDGLIRIECPTRIATGGDSVTLYADIADALCARISGADHRSLAGLDHMAPIIRPDSVAASVEAFADR
jgi:pimeloyl-ACP methyl ester carboxylesterase